MGYPISAKAIEIAHNYADNIKQRGSAGPLATLFGGPIPVVEGFDSAGLPTISVGTLTTGSAGAFIQVGPAVWPLAQDVLGNTAAIYTPTVIRIAVEAPAASGSSLIDGPMQTTDFAILMALLGDACQTGARVEFWNSAAGTAPSDSTFNTPGNLVATFENFQYPLVGNV